MTILNKPSLKVINIPESITVNNKTFLFSDCKTCTDVNEYTQLLSYIRARQPGVYL